MTCQTCEHRRAVYAVAWRGPSMASPAYLRLCRRCAAHQSGRTFEPGTHIRVHVLDRARVSRG